MSYKKRLCFDWDGIIAKNNSGNYKDAPVIQYSVDNINKAFDLGYYIIISTARYGLRFPGQQYQKGYIEGVEWLNKYGVKYHELYFGKPAADLYPDDKGLRLEPEKGPQEWDKFWQALKELDNKDQYNQLIEKTNEETRINRKEETNVI